MKKLRFGILALLLLVTLLLLASCDGVTVSRVYVNDEKHAIVEYSDGTTEDLGYVGVEVEKIVEVEKEVLPPKYTVTFVDASGTTIKTEKVYKGDAATAPEAPEVVDKAFDRWDVAFDVVTGDLTVRPVYVDAAEYTVTFVDENGATIKTETVIHGRGATAPEAPKRADTIFKEWDTSFDSVKGNLTVTAVYRAKETFTVTFKDYSGVTLGTANVKETDTAVAPVTPTREGYTFTGWSSALTNVTASKTVTAEYALVDGSNILDFSYNVAADGTVTLTATVKGDVCFAALQGEIALPSGVTDVALVEGGGVAITNYVNGVIKCVFSSGTGANVTKETKLFTVTFKTASETVMLETTIDTITDQSATNVTYSVIGETLKIK